MNTFLLVVLVFSISIAAEELSRKELLSLLNVNASRSVDESRNEEQLSPDSFTDMLMDAKFIKVPEDTPILKLKKTNFLMATKVRESFDARREWPKCWSIGWIRQQSQCGSCWAVAAASMASDRMCINAPYYPMMLSSEDLLSCCGSYCGNGCSGGWPDKALNWWATNGLVTGTDYSDHQGCRPYTVPTCSWHNGVYSFPYNGAYRACPETFSVPQCYQQCQNGYFRNYTQDKYYGQPAYHVRPDVSAIQAEILEHGPVVATFTVYEDFNNFYKRESIYQHRSGGCKRPGGCGHVVKIIGWGVENQIPYWLCANSWGTQWGDGGFFRIRRGTNECGIETNVVAAMPRK
ncbi:unnamed protein product, partial [Mesorhabditis belari]|uniref:Peptidase C1A papain C-terminal domain-containing protein n=1 Tax=Mesorhabditis belari TaxID=2138241 RepID=A0AAF3J264_9BILA